MKQVFVCTVLSAAMLLGMPARSSAQAGAAAIAGVVRDTTGAVLPGVTVEASSPALIEKSRTVVTDEQGAYRVVDLRPGPYTVTFSLSGFSTVRREGIDLTPNFTATVAAELQVGAIEETVVVSGQSPLVDVQNVTQQETFSRELLDTVPTNKGMLAFAALTPAVISPTTAQDVGGSKGEMSVRMVIHGGKSGDQKLQQDGMRYNSLEGGGTGRGFFLNPASALETVVELGAGGSAEYSVGGVHVNIVPKDGANRFSSYFATNYTDHNFQGNNLTDELRDRGLISVNSVSDIYDINGALGGPIMQDRLWFFTAHRHWGQSTRVANVFHNATQDGWLYTPDLSRPAESVEWNYSSNVRFTWQASQKNKVTLSWDVQNNCSCQVNLGVGNVAWEAVPEFRYSPNYLIQATWSNPVSSRVLLEAGTTTLYFTYPNNRQEGVTEEHISVLEQSTNFRYRSRASNYGHIHSGQSNHRFSFSYVTGAHNFKTGVFFQHGVRRPENNVNQDLNYTFLNGTPISLTQWATPIKIEERMKADLGLFAQDQWTINRLTLNAGLRYDYLNAYNPAVDLPAGRFIQARSFEEAPCLPCWHDISPRFGAVYDLFGTGRTAVKASIGKYMTAQTVTLADTYHAANTSVNNVSRSWTDLDRDFVPDCDLLNTGLNGECGPMNNSAFGQVRITTRPDQETIKGWGVRGYNWQASMSVQHQLTGGVAVGAGYYRTWFGNFNATDNLEVTPEDYDPYCITAPANAGLPSGGGYEVCGLYDIDPTMFGRVNNLVTFSSNFGTQTEVYNGVDVNVSARMPRGAMLSGGWNIGNQMSTGFSATEACFVVDSPQALRHCNVDTPYQSRVKVYGSYPLGWAMQASANFQTLPGPPISATYSATTAEIAPSLGRPLAGGTRTASVELIDPYTQFEGRINQLDVRLAKTFQWGRARIQGMFDVYNVLNASPVLALNTAYGPAWLRPTQILDARLLKFGAQIDF